MENRNAQSEETEKVRKKCEMALLNAFTQSLERLQTARADERRGALEDVKTLASICKDFGLSLTSEAIGAVHTEVVDAKLGDSITLTLKCVSACHLRIFMSSLDSLEVAMMEDLKQLPGCRGYDLTDFFIKIEISEVMYKECEANLIESEYSIILDK